MTKKYVPTKNLAELDLNSELTEFESNLRSKRDQAISVADYRSERGEVVAALLEAVASEVGDEECSAYAERLKKCADKNNFYYGEDFLDNSTGELFSGFGNLFGCGLKLCQSCVARQAARNRNIARQAVNNTKLLNREHYCYLRDDYIIEQEKYRFVTLTMPEVKASLKKTMMIQKRAWDLFRKLKFFKNYFAGHIKSVEFTFRLNGTYHTHSHLLAITFFIPEELIKLHWTNCVEKAFNEFGIEFEAEQANVNLKLPDSLEDVIKELCKYITKTTTWEQIPASHLLEIAQIRRWDRMFEVGGRFRQTIQKLNAERSAFSSSAGIEDSLKEDKKSSSSYYL
ncbi:Replication protein, partial [Necator americanus]